MQIIAGRYHYKKDTMPSNFAIIFCRNETGAALSRFITRRTNPSLVMRIAGSAFPDGQIFGDGKKFDFLNSLLHSNCSMDLKMSLWDFPN
jgi:hypothetical protein